MFRKSGKNLHSSTVVANGNPEQISLQRISYLPKRNQLKFLQRQCYYNSILTSKQQIITLFVASFVTQVVAA